MTAALYLLADGALAGAGAGDTLWLEGAEAHHAATVKRARTGEELLVADGSGVRGVTVVEELTGDGPPRVRLRLERLEDARPPGPRLVLAQALAKAGRDEQAVETATEYGVDAVVPWQARRCVVVWRGERGARSRRKWETTVRAAAKQARRASVPVVEDPVSTEDLARLVARQAAAFVLHEDAPSPLAGAAVPDEGDVLLVVGPEGGIDPEELETLVAAGARPVRLGPEVLRSSSAGPAALAVLNAATRWRRQDPASSP